SRTCTAYSRRHRVRWRRPHTRGRRHGRPVVPAGPVGPERDRLHRVGTAAHRRTPRRRHGPCDPTAHGRRLHGRRFCRGRGRPDPGGDDRPGRLGGGRTPGPSALHRRTRRHVGTPGHPTGTRPGGRGRHTFRPRG